MEPIEVTTAYAFVCPACGDRMEVDDASRQYILQEGCLLCGTEASVTDFESA